MFEIISFLLLHRYYKDKPNTGITTAGININSSINSNSSSNSSNPSNNKAIDFIDLLEVLEVKDSLDSTAPENSLDLVTPNRTYTLSAPDEVNQKIYIYFLYHKK